MLHPSQHITRYFYLFKFFKYRNMEDIIYFLLLIGWVAFSFYQQNEKKKRKKAQMEAARSNEQNDNEQDDHMSEDEQQESSGSDFKRVFEGLLMDDEDEMEMETASESSTRQSPEEEKKNVYQNYFENELARRNAEENKLKSQVELEKKIAALEKDMVLLEEDHNDTESQTVNRFNLRDAVIYSEILSRKY